MFYLSTNDKGGKKGTFQFSQRPGVKCNSWWQGVRSSHAIFTDSPAEYIFIQELCVCLAFSASFCHPEHAFTTIFLWLNRKSLLLSLGPLKVLVGATCHPKDFLSFFLTDTNIKTDRQFDDQTIRLFLSLSAICCHFWSAEGRQNLWISMNDNTHRHTPNNTQDTGGTTHKTRGLRYLHRFAFNLQ